MLHSKLDKLHEQYLKIDLINEAYQEFMSPSEKELALIKLQ